MKNEQSWRLLQAIGEIRDETVRDALPPARRNLRPIVKWASLAAAVLICAGVMAAVMLGGDGLLPGGDTGTPTHAGITENTESTGLSETTGEPYPETSEQTTEEKTEETTVALTGMQTPGAAFTPVTSIISPIGYSGPILPLTAEGNTDGLRVVRQLTLYTEEVHYRLTASFPDFLVTDCYILENTADTPITVTLLYPVITDCTTDAAAWPVIELRGSGKMETVTPDLYAGVFTGWYTGGAVGDPHTLNPQTPSTAEEYGALLGDGSYRRDALSRTDMGTRQVLDYGRFGLTPPGKEDPETHQRQTLSRLIRDAAAQYRQQREKYYDFVPDTFLFEALPEKLLLSIVHEELERLGPLGDTPIDRWSDSFRASTLEDIVKEIFAQERVFYLSFEITVPADGYETVFIRQERTAAFDHRDMSMFRIDAVPALDTSLWLAAQDFIVPDGETYEIVRTSEEPRQAVGGISIPMKEAAIWVDLRKTE